MKSVAFEPKVKVGMMRVDAHNFCDNVVFMCFAMAVIVITVIAAYAGPQQLLVEERTFPLDETAVTTVETSLTDLACFNLFTSMFLSFRRKFGTGETTKRMKVDLSVSSMAKKAHVLSPVCESENVFEIVCLEGAEGSTPILVFYDKLVFRTNYHVSLVIHESDVFSHVTVEWRSGDPMTSWILIILRLVLCFVIFAAAFMYLRRALDLTFPGWTLEQKLTLLLLVMCLLADFPLSNLYRSEEALLWSLPHIVIVDLFETLVALYIVILFTWGCAQRVIHSGWKVFMVVVMFFGLFVGHVATSVAYVWDVFKTNLLSNGKLKSEYGWQFRVAGFIIDIVFIIHSYLNVDQTERFRFVVYLCHSLLMMVVTVAGKVGIAMDVPMPLISILDLVGYNVFVLVMSYLHWPYEYLSHGAYQDAAIQDEDKQSVVQIVDNGDDEESIEVIITSHSC